MRYEFPDMQDAGVDMVVRQLHEPAFTSISCANISKAVLILPRQIILKAGVNKRCFWEAECSQLNPPGPYQQD